MLPLMLAAFCGGSITDVVSLDGTLGTPINASDSGASAQAGWQWRADGTQYKLQANAGDAQYGAGTNWIDQTPTITYYIRMTQQSFSGDGSIVDALETTWTALTSNRSFEIDDPQGTGPTEIVVKVEIATDSGGSNIIATGYYSATAEDDT